MGKQPIYEVAYNLKQDRVGHPVARKAVFAELAQKYYDTYKPNNPVQRDLLGAVISQAGLGHDVGLALWDMRKTHPNDPILLGVQGADQQHTMLSATEELLAHGSSAQPAQKAHEANKPAASHGVAPAHEATSKAPANDLGQKVHNASKQDKPAQSTVPRASTNMPATSHGVAPAAGVPPKTPAKNPVPVKAKGTDQQHTPKPTNDELIAKANSSELAKRYYDTYKPDNPTQRDLLGAAINKAGLGHDVGLALWDMRKTHPNDPILLGTKGINQKQTSLSASQELNDQANGSKARNEISFYNDGLSKLQDSRTQVLLDEICFRLHPNSTANDGIYDISAIQKMATLKTDSPEWSTSVQGAFVKDLHDRQNMINAAKVVVAPENASFLKDAAGGDGIFGAHEMKNATDKFNNRPKQSATIDKQTSLQDPYLTGDKKIRDDAAAKAVFRQNLATLTSEAAYNLADESEHWDNVVITGNDRIVGVSGFKNIAKMTPNDPRWDTVDPRVPMGQRQSIIDAAKAVTSPANTAFLKEASGGDFVFGSTEATDWIDKYDADMKSPVKLSADDIARDPLLAINGEHIVTE